MKRTGIGIVLAFLSVFTPPSPAQDVGFVVLAQKLNLFASIIADSAALENVNGSKNAKAKRLLADARTLADAASRQLADGDFEQGQLSIDAALKKVSLSFNLVKPNKARSSVEKARYRELLQAIDSIKKLPRNDPETEVDALVKRARAKATAGNYEAANRVLNQAAEKMAAIVAGSYGDRKTVVYSLEFGSPGEEYDYELRRFDSNLMLIDLMRKNFPSSPIQAKIDDNIRLAKRSRDAAYRERQADNTPSAIASMEQAGTHLTRALRLLGVSF